MKQPIIMAGLYEKTQREKNIEDGKIDKYYFLSEINSLPSITQDDLHFAETVYKEYNKIPFDDLCWLVRDLRYTIEKYKTAAGTNDIKFESISINSNKGTINVPADVFFKSKQCKEIRLLSREISDSRNKELEFYLSLTLNKIWRFLKVTQLGESQKRVVAGMILVYFKLPEKKPIPTKTEWDENQISGTYKRFLNDTVKSLVKKLK